MERMSEVDGVEEEEEDDEEQGLLFLVKGWRDSCLDIASTTVAGTFTGETIENGSCELITQVYDGFKTMNDETDLQN